MSTVLIAVCGALYLLTAADLWWEGKTGLALTFAAYALANVGLIMAARQG